MADRARNLLASADSPTRRSARIPKSHTTDTRKSLRRSEIGSPSSSKIPKLSHNVDYESQSNVYRRDSSSMADGRRSILQKSTSSNSRTPARGQSSTSDLNRRACADNVQKVMRVLQYDKDFYKRLNLNNGLRSMSAKQFVDIIAYFHGISTGKILNTNRPVDCETNVLNFIKNIHYPFPVSRSWLKTPAATHAYSECVALLAWLSDLVCTEDLEHSNECDSAFPSVEFTERFSRDALSEYKKCNGHPDVRCIAWIEKMVEARLIAGLKNHVQNRNEFDKLMENMQSKIEKLEKIELKEPSKESLMMIEQIQIDEQQLQSLKEDINKRTHALDKIYLHSCQQSQINAKHEAIEKIQEILSKQRVKHDDYALAKEKLKMLEETIESLKKQIDTLGEDSAKEVLKKARLVKLRNDDIAKINRIGFKMTQIILLSKLNVAYDADAIQIGPRDSDDKIKMVCKTMDRLIKNVQCHKQQIGISIEQKKIELNKIQLLENRSNDRHEAAKKKFQELNVRLGNADAIYVQQKSSCDSAIREAKKQMERLIGERDTLTEKIRDCNDRCALLKLQNVEILEEGERKATELIDTKLKIIETLDEVIAHIDEIVIETDSNADK